MRDRERASPDVSTPSVAGFTLDLGLLAAEQAFGGRAAGLNRAKLVDDDQSVRHRLENPAPTRLALSHCELIGLALRYIAGDADEEALPGFLPRLADREVRGKVIAVYSTEFRGCVAVAFASGGAPALRGVNPFAKMRGARSP
jgi:hypothetical protein